MQCDTVVSIIALSQNQNFLTQSVATVVIVRHFNANCIAQNGMHAPPHRPWPWWLLQGISLDWACCLDGLRDWATKHSREQLCFDCYIMAFNHTFDISGSYSVSLHLSSKCCSCYMKTSEGMQVAQLLILTSLAIHLLLILQAGSFSHDWLACCQWMK